MIGRIYAVGLNTFRWAIRHRFLIAVLVVSAGVMLFALVLGEMSLHQETRVAVDVALGGTSFFGSITAMVLGALLLYTEIQRRTIHTMLAKPIERHELLLGRYAGMAASLTLLLAVSSLLMAGMFWLQDVAFTGAVAKALLLTWIEVLVVAAVAAFFSSFSSPVLSGVFTAGIWLVGRATDELRAAVESAASPVIRAACRAALYVVPDLHLFQISGSRLDGAPVSVHAEFVSWSYLAAAAGHGLLYIAILLGLAVVIFARRDFLVKWRRVAACAVVIGFCAGVVVTRAVWQGRSALDDGDRALAAGDREEAIRWWRRAARWYVPLAPHVTAAYDRLEAIAAEAEASGDAATALAAWQGVRGSILATRSFFVPHEERLEPANRRIAALLARSEGAAPDSGAGERERTAWHYSQLERDESPDVGWSLLALVGFFTWLGGGALFAWRGISADDRLVARVATTSGLLIASGLVLWLLGLYRA